jgi:D-psicose/D-tagatose/L-ribulose 3-epimerase
VLVKLGMNMLLWSDDVTDERFQPVFEMLADAGYDGVEIPVFALDPAPYERLASRLEPLGLERIAVTARGEAASPISPHAEVRAAAVRENLQALDCAGAMGATLLCGPFETALGVFSGCGPTEDEWGCAVESLRAVAEAADERGITLAIEYLNRFEQYLVNSAQDAARLCRDVGHPRCRMMYDTFHAHIEEKDIRQALESCKDVLEYVHLSENDRSTPGQGQVDWDTTFAALRAIGYDGWLTIEAFGDALPSLAAATKIWRRMFESEEQLARDGARFVRERWAA